MAIQEIKLDPEGANPEVEIIIGQAQFGEYIVSRKDTTGTKHEIKEGDNDDDVTDKFPVGGTAANLKDQILRWHLLIRALTDDPNELYFAQLVVTQDNKPADGGTFTYQGQLDEVKNIFDVARFVHKT